MAFCGLPSQGPLIQIKGAFFKQSIMTKIGFISLGCPKNLVDSEVMMGQLQQNGYQITANAEDADTVVVNTCGFIDSAKKESIDAILEAARLKTEGKAKRLVVAGCLVERYRDELKAEMPEVDAFIGTSQINDILSVCDPKTNTRSLPVIPLGNQSATYLYDESTPRVLATPSHYAFIKIAEGCDRRAPSASFHKCADTFAVAGLDQSSLRRINLLKRV